jgi:superfamily II DNA or RNA helicase
MAHYSDYFYIEKEKLPYNELRKHLRIFGKGKDDMPIVRDTWEDFDDFWGVPRAWGLKNFKGRNKTKRPKAEWKPKGKYVPRYNQEEVITKAVKILRNTLGCRLEAKTGYGKTATCLQIASKLKTRVLIVVDKEDLADQWKKEFEKFFEGEVGLVQGDTLDYDHPVTIAMSQTLYSRKDDFPQKFWKHFGCIIVDEGHSFSAKSFFTTVNKFYARYRLACSATWRRKDELDPLWDLSISDEVVKGVRTDALKRLYKVEEVKFGFTTGQFIRHWDKQPDFNRILKALAESEDYNKWLVERTKSLLKTRKQVIIVCSRTAQIEALEDLFDEDVGIYTGKHRDKKVTKKELEEAKKKRIILATLKKVEKGSDIPSLDTMIIASPISDPEQLIGRIARQHEGKTDCLVIDVRFKDIVFTNKSERSRDSHYKKLGWIQV